MSRFQPRKARSQNDIVEKESLLCVENIFLNTDVKTYFSENDKTPNTDGWIDLIDNGTLCGKIVVQIKTLPARYKKIFRFDVPDYLLGYADKIKTDVVILLVADYDNQTAYWKYINEDFILECDRKPLQHTYVYHFKDFEALNSFNKNDVIKTWKKLYSDKKKSIIDIKSRSFDIIRKTASTYNLISTDFWGINNSYIERKEVNDLLKWISTNHNEGEIKNLSILIGTPGSGKSVIMKQLLLKLNQENIPTFALKADRKISFPEGEITALDFIKIFKIFISENNGRAVLIIDQIDALSQSLSNDRDAISEYLELIKEFSTGGYPQVKVIVSCREFDLNSDPTLNKLDGGRILKLETLSLDEVTSVLKQLNINNPKKSISESTIELLRTPQHLDTFCRIYKNGGNKKNYHTPEALYDELWKITILKGPDSVQNEKFIYDVGQRMQLEETLNPGWVSSANDTAVLDYLQKEGIISFDGLRISFFHQSFYDYVISRYYTLHNKSLFDDIFNKHQGLFVRSTIKQVLSFKRGHNEIQYKREIKAFLKSDKIRFHIKLLILQSIASNDSPLNSEIQLIRSFESTDFGFFCVFLGQQLNLKWFDSLIDLVANDIKQLNEIDENARNSIYFFLAKHANNRATKVFEQINKIPIPNEQLSCAKWALRFVTDFTIMEVTNWINIVKENSFEDYLRILEAAIPTAPELVCCGLLDILISYIPKWKDYSYNRDSDHNNYILFEKVLPILVERHPLLIYPTLKTVLLKGIKESRQNYFGEFLDDDYIFGSDNLHIKDHHIILDWVVEILSKQISKDYEWVYQELDSIIKIEVKSIYVLTFRVMDIKPNLFTDRLLKMFQNKGLIEYLLGWGDQNYYFRELLKNSFEYFTSEEKNYVMNFVLNFNLKTDFLPDKERKIKNLLFPNWGYKKRELIYCIHKEFLSPLLLKTKGELDRRFSSDKCPNDKPQHLVTAAHLSTGLVSEEKYNRFSHKEWLNSFKKGINHFSIKNDNLYFDERSHSEAFSKYVSLSTKKHIKLVIRLFSDNEIRLAYKIAGLKGLLEGNYDIEKCFDLYHSLFFQNEDSQPTYDLIRFSKYFLNDQFQYVNEIIYYLTTLIQSSKTDTAYAMIEDTTKSKLNILSNLNKGINSLAGVSLSCLIKIAELTDYRTKIYELLITFHHNLSKEHKLVVLNEVNNIKYYDKILFEKLFSIYITDPLPEIVIISQHTINYFLKNDSKVVVPYIRSVLNFSLSQEHLTSLIFLGIGYGCSECEELLEKLISFDKPDIINMVIKMSINCIYDPSFTVLSKRMLLRFKDDDRTEIISEYTHNFHSLNEESFNLFEKIFQSIKFKMKTDNHGVREYLKKCTPYYPEECFHCLKQIVDIDKSNSSLDQDENLEILLSIYKNIKESDDEAIILDDIMDTFDKMIKSNRFYKLTEVLKEVDRN